MTSKKRHRNMCAHHPERRAQGSCAACGTRLCRECALVVRGVHYCLLPGCRPAELQSSASEPAAPAPSDRFWRTLVFRSSVTVALCAAVFAVWTVREVVKLHTENATLRTSRLALIEQLKSSNQRIGSLISVKGDEGMRGEKPAIPALPPPTDRRTAPVAAGWRSGWTAENTAHHFSNGPVDRPAVSLTFDGGSLANVAGAVLDTLASRSVTATMFLTGEFIRNYPDITRRIIAEGHECGNHTAGHPHLTSFETDRTRSTLPSVTSSMLAGELLRADELFFTVTGASFSPLWRAPYGEFNREICRWAYEAGYLHIGWRQGKTWREGLDSNDWISDSETPGYHTPAEFFDKVMALSKQQPMGINGGIMLFHLGTERKSSDTQVHIILGALIDTVRAEGYNIVPVSEMVASAGIDLASLRERIHIQ